MTFNDVIYTYSWSLVFKRWQPCIATSNGGSLKCISMRKSLENQNRYPSPTGLFLAVGPFQRTAFVFPKRKGELQHSLQSPSRTVSHHSGTLAQLMWKMILTIQWLGVSPAFVLSGCIRSPFCCWSDSALWFFQGHYLQWINLSPSPWLLPLKFVFLSLFVLSDRANTTDGAFSSQYP